MKHYETTIDAEKHPVTRKIQDYVKSTEDRTKATADADDAVAARRVAQFTRKPDKAPLAGVLKKLTGGI